MANLGGNDEEVQAVGRWFRRVFSRVDESKHMLKRYESNINSYDGRGRWCGPWVCGFILFVNQGVDVYDFLSVMRRRTESLDS